MDKIVIRECHGCGWDLSPVKEYSRALNRGDKLWLCEICANTPIGNSAEYPDQFEGQLETLKP